MIANWTSIITHVILLRSLNFGICQTSGMLRANLLSIDLVLDDWMKTWHIFATFLVPSFSIIPAVGIHINGSFMHAPSLLQTGTHVLRTRPNAVDQLIRVSLGAR